jgi:hypothetical protein
MSKALFRPPRHLVKEWPEVFEDMYMNTMPVAYLDLITIEFNDGKIWEIDIANQLKDSDADAVCAKLLDIMQEYKNSIVKMDFKIDVDKLKKDIKDEISKIF